MYTIGECGSIFNRHKNIQEINKTIQFETQILTSSPREHMLMTSMVMPPVAYHADGQPASAVYAIVPCQFNMGLICSALTYCDHLHFLLVGDAEHCSSQERNAEEAERALTRWRACAFLRERLGEEFDSRITGFSDQGVTVRLEPLAQA